MKKKRILAIISTPPPVHGSSIMNNYVYKSNLLRDSFFIDFVQYNFVTGVSEIGELKFSKILTFLKYFFQIFFKLIIKKPDLVYFPIVPYGNSFYRDSILVILIKLFKVPIVYHLHGKGATKHYNNDKNLYDYVYKDANIICLSKILIYDISFANGPIHIVPNGIEQKIHESKRNFNERPNLLYLSNFVKEKGVLQLLNAIALIKSKGVTDFTLNLVGSFTKEVDRELIENFIISNNLQENVIIKGPLYDKDKDDILRKSDIFCFPTYYKNECFPLVNLEAMQFSLPIISSFEGGIPDMISDGYNGFLVDPFETEKLANSILSLITNKQLRISMSKNSFKRFNDHYTLKIFEKKLLKTFNDILNE